MKLKAEKVLEVEEMLKPGRGISWTAYSGNDVAMAAQIHSRFNAFLMSGDPMPVTGMTHKLNIMSVEKSYDDSVNHHQVIIEAIVLDKRKEKSPNE